MQARHGLLASGIYNSSCSSHSVLDLSKLNRFMVVEWTFTMAAAVELSYAVKLSRHYRRIVRYFSVGILYICYSKVVKSVIS